jgi:hypothetical protein
MIALPVPPSQPSQSLLPNGRSLPEWHRLALAEIAQSLSAEHAGLFATPAPGADGIAWLTEGDHPVPLVQLAAEDRALLTAAIGSILSDLRRLVESGRAPFLTLLWPALRQVPDQRHIFLVHGRPVLAAWGHRGPAGSVSAGEDDGLPGETPEAPLPRRPGSYAWPLAVLALVALVAGGLIPWASGLWAAPAFCRIDPAQLGAFSSLQQEIDQGNALRTMLAQLMEETGQRRAQCAPPPKPGLTQTLWDNRDLSVLKGCWNRTSNMTLYDVDSNKPVTVQSWHMCFDENGGGTQDIVLTDGRSCNGPLTAHFESKTLVISEPQKCEGTMNLVHGATSCQRVNVNEADCTRREDEGPDIGSEAQGTFQR